MSGQIFKDMALVVDNKMTNDNNWAKNTAAANPNITNMVTMGENQFTTDVLVTFTTAGQQKHQAAIKEAKSNIARGA